VISSDPESQEDAMGTFKGSLQDKLMQVGLVSKGDVKRVEKKTKLDGTAKARHERERAIAEWRRERSRQIAAVPSGEAPPAIVSWSGFEARVRALGFGWALGGAPKDLAWAKARAHKKPGWEAGFPDAYRSFVEKVGCPWFAFRRYCRDGFALLPIEAVAVLSPDVGDQELELDKAADKKSAPCRYRFFAGIDLAEHDGWAFSADPQDGLDMVWEVEAGMAGKPCGSFDRWLAEKLAALVILMERMPAEEASELRDGHDPDPYRVVDYADGM
jgi:hypothetical protein